MSNQYSYDTTVHMNDTLNPENEVMPEVQTIEWVSEKRGKYISVKIDNHTMFMSEAQFEYLRQAFRAIPDVKYVD